MTTDEELEKICNEYLQSLKLTQQQDIALTNISQDDSINSIWQQARRCRLTSSNFGRVAKRRSKYEKLVENILYKPPPSTLTALEWGKSHEDIARRCYINEKTGTHGVHTGCLLLEFMCAQSNRGWQHHLMALWKILQNRHIDNMGYMK